MTVPGRDSNVQLCPTLTSQPVSTGVSCLLARGKLAAQVLLLILGILTLGLLLFFQVVRWAGWEPYRVQGTSMEPTILQGSLVLTQATPSERLRPGDVAIFSASWAEVAGEQLRVVHRLIRVSPVEGGVLGYTQGDGSQIADPAPTLFRGQVKVVTTVVPYVGYAYTFVKQGCLLVVASVLALGLLFRFRSRRAYSSPESRVA